MMRTRRAKPNGIGNYLEEIVMKFGKMSVALGLCLVAATSTSLAKLDPPEYQEFIYSGNNCKPINGNESGDFSYYFNRIYNNASAVRYVVCPVVRHYTRTTLGPNTFAVQLDNPGTTNMSCTLYAMNGTGSAMDSTTVSTSLSGSRYLTSTKSLRANRYAGEYVVYCGMPAGASIYNYKVHEYSDIEN